MLAPLIALSILAAPAAKPAAPTNTVCPVLGGKVTPGKSPKVAVRGQEYYICCPGCDTKLLKDPDKYLEKNGTPKNTPKK